MGTQRCARRAAHNYNEQTHHESGTRSWTDEDDFSVPHPKDPITLALYIAEQLLVQDEYERGNSRSYSQLVNDRDPQALAIEQARTQHRKNNGA
jgi:hypothetical protein